VIYEEGVESHELAIESAEVGAVSVVDFWTGKVPEAAILAHAATRYDLPIIFFGESIDPDENIYAPPMTTEAVIDAMRAILKLEGRRPWVILWDYIQETPTEHDLGTRTGKVIGAMTDVIRLGLRLSCPIELGAQANKEALKRNPPIPEAGDLEYSNFIFQKSSQVVAIWRPWVTSADQSKIMVGGVARDNAPNLTVFKPLKRRVTTEAQSRIISVPVKLFPASLTFEDYPGIGERVF
jgi:hypothetical protein